MDSVNNAVSIRNVDGLNLLTLTALFTKLLAEPFSILSGRNPVEQKKFLKPRMGERSLNAVPAGSRESGGLMVW